MATGSQLTAELVGSLFEGVTPEAALNVAKILRTSGLRLDRDLWPSPGSGVRIVGFKPAHLTNLVLALACGVPTQAVETVARYREVPRAGWPREISVAGRMVFPAENALADPRLTETDTIFTTRDRPDLLTLFPALFPDTLGLVFDNLIAEWANPGLSEAARAMLRTSEILVALGRSPRADHVLRGLPGTEEPELRTRYELASADAQSDAPRVRPMMIFDGALFERLGAIWAGTQAYDETAASPARDAAAPGDPPATADGCPTQAAHPTGERDNPQPPPSVRSGHLPLNDGVTDDAGRMGAALAAAAQARRDAGRSQTAPDLS